MYNIVLRPLLHRGQECLAVVAPLVRRLDLAIRQLRGVKWSHSNKVWYLPLSRESHGIILAALQSLATIAQGPLRNLPAKTKEGGCHGCPLSNGPRHAGTRDGFPKSANANYGLAAKPRKPEGVKPVFSAPEAQSVQRF